MARSEDNRFTVRAFLRDKVVGALIWLLAIAFTSLLLVMVGVARDAIILIDIVLVAALVAVLLVQYRQRVRFWNELSQAMRAFDKVQYFGTLESEPSFVEGRIAFEAIQKASMLATDEITSLRAQSAEHSEYVELWVHEIKTPIAAAKLILSKMHGADEERLKYEVERLESLVEQALFAARSDSLSNDYLLREANLASLVNEACKDNMRYLTSSGIAIDMQVDRSIDVIADKTWMIFILSQLITNAAKYDARTITFSAQQADREGPDACTTLEIKDDGCGIPASDVPRVFDRGFTGEVGRAHGSATGMGLYLAARLCAQMGVGIMLASEEGLGTRVCLSFPHDRRRAQVHRV